MVKNKRKNDGGTLGKALAGHAFRAAGNEAKAAEYDNPLTDWINLVIAEAKAKQNRITANNKMKLTLKGRGETAGQMSGSVAAPLQGSLF